MPHVLLLQGMSPLMAHIPRCLPVCLLLGRSGHRAPHSPIIRGASDPTETLAARDLCGAHCRTAHHFPLVRYAVLHSTYQELAEHYGLGLTGEPQGLPPKVERR
jgi:hypothetical protein